MARNPGPRCVQHYTDRNVLYFVTIHFLFYSPFIIGPYITVIAGIGLLSTADCKRMESGMLQSAGSHARACFGTLTVVLAV